MNGPAKSPFRTLGWVAIVAGLMFPALMGSSLAHGQASNAAPAAGPAPVTMPSFWDPRRRPERPDVSRITLIRFLTEIDYPPFNYAGPDGNPAGFNVDLARMICEELKIACTMQMRRFDTLVAALGENRGDAVMASLAVTPDARRSVDFSDPYYRTPARFVARRESLLEDMRPEQLEGREVAVVGGTAHEAYLRALFTEADLRVYPDAGIGARGAETRRRRSPVRRRHLACVLAQRHRVRRLLRFPGRPLHREPLLRRRHRHRGPARQRHAASGVQLGIVPALGERPFQRSVAAIFSDQSVLSDGLFVCCPLFKFPDLA
jgi:ABC-type amino acid transport substrate-binding protein